MEAFRKLYDEHVGFVQFVAMRTGVRGSDVDDVVQETFLRLHVHGASLKDPAKVRAWLATTARRVVIDQARKRRERLVDGEAPDVPAPRDDEEAGHEQDLALVRDMVDEVAADKAGGETFRLFYVDGLTAREIAARNGEAVSTVTTRLTRLRDAFKDKFRKRIEDLRDRRV